MKNYVVTYSFEVEVEAENREQAIEKANDSLCVWTPKSEVDGINEVVDGRRITALD